MNPRFSEFDLARTFEGDDKVSETKRVTGTLPVQSPPLSIPKGLIPDISMQWIYVPGFNAFSFGILLLKIISDQKISSFNHPDPAGPCKAMELVDACLEDSIVESLVLRCIQVALICVQNLPKDRPTMSLVNFMLTNEEASLPFPKVPGFFTDTSSNTNTTTRKKDQHTVNAVTITMFLLVWNEEKSLELLGICLKDPIVESQVLRSIQSFPEDRPTMSSVNFMLANGDANLPHPKESCFFTEKSLDADIAASKNADTITMLGGR
ncbi:G-type lectin S-receptor-like serine/threonine-protein kinase SRK [Gossypium australe]|uniref:G-type lectin S-receptor-like serine/threonine-protein kinase SRK n=1 Tax=Gossypium australe TaxID=47621 RepID=A0A5B6VEW4_9ROSI|nr:G-type lectin S-receptor-like serine/threonine-protein kinase SRK [Gossypium australe]